MGFPLPKLTRDGRRDDKIQGFCSESFLFYQIRHSYAEMLSEIAKTFVVSSYQKGGIDK